ncbi:Transglutaminase-like superfamily protein [Methanohalophilus portucalensis FDF-1]|nr:hypothetical protein MPF_0454 [Methanohalophilus portucalensis FDF-1]SMH34716.1 Transglutaminase-like superfamily protein [Methanohalophilus portucalensis FDF-1]
MNFDLKSVFDNMKYSFTQAFNKKTIAISFIILLIIFLLPKTSLVVFDYVYGETVMDETSSMVIGNSSDPNEMAISIMSWESSHFYNPYSNFDKDSKLQKFGLYNYSGSIEESKLFWRDAPVPWIIHFGTANCEEYSRVFVELMRHNGADARFIHSLAGDHCWAEYKNENGNWIVVDPSCNRVIGTARFEFAKHWNRDLCYIEVIDENSNWIDVSDQYINRSDVYVEIHENGKPVDKYDLYVYNHYLKDTKGGKYDKPIIAIRKQSFNKSGISTFKLGTGNYTFTLMNPHFPFFKYQLPVNITENKPKHLVYNLDEEQRIYFYDEFWIMRFISCFSIN